jgi:hypothetical protein
MLSFAVNFARSSQLSRIIASFGRPMASAIPDCGRETTRPSRGFQIGERYDIFDDLRVTNFEEKKRPDHHNNVQIPSTFA